MRFNIDSESPLPVYQQLKQSIILEILSSRLKEGDQLPPIRELAKILKINPNTVAKVYYNLEEEGFARGKRGSGFWIRIPHSGLDRLKITLIEDELKTFLEKAFSLGFSGREIKQMMRRYLNHD